MVETVPSKAEALLDFALRYKGAMLLYAMKRTGVWEDAQDAVSETLARVWHKSSQWRADKGSARAWIYTILRNICIDIARDKAHQVPSVPLEESVAGVEYKWMRHHDLDPAPLPDENAERMELRERIEAAVNRLSDTYRKVAILQVMEGKSYAEICEEIGCSYNTNKIHAYRMKRILRKNPRLQESAEELGLCQTTTKAGKDNAAHA